MEEYILLITAIVAFGVAALTGPVIIPVLHRLKFGQEIREIGPSWHKKKSGTPTMGGFIFIFSVILVTLIFIRDPKVLFVLLFSLVFGAIGFVDDFIKVILKRNLGLTEKQKSLMQIAAALVFVFALFFFDMTDTTIAVPFMSTPLVLPVYLYIPFVLFVIVGATNSVNLTDGVDGLAASVTVVVCSFFALVAYNMGETPIAGFCVINAAALLGFLLFNAHPAKVFMGDTGSLYLGGVVCFIAIVLKLPLILIIAGGVYVLETLSVIIQVTSFKLTGKRVFKMSPIHHHFEMCGWSEKKIVLTAILITMLLCTVSYFMCV
ncbi:MAG: phospho-N-acetylmuramoyl-pentapeptide-transferase [Clostridia bacterium]|nr:phospho-N-acetylmuramoyl-pentapeptide-transferase [Clostridia bacterium]